MELLQMLVGAGALLTLAWLINKRWEKPKQQR
jgi:hypothetical protein